MDNKLEATDHFKDKVKKFSREPKKKITTFIQTFQEGGFSAIDNVKINGIKVRNKSSDDVPTSDPQFVSKVKLAQKYNLWHYHAGFYNIDCDFDGYNVSSCGDLTSQWVIHYQLFTENHINIVDVTPHPPFLLPNEEHLTVLPSPDEKKRL